MGYAKRLLMIEDDSHLRSAVQRMLRFVSKNLGSQLESEWVGSGEEATEKLSRNVYDIVIVDFMLPGGKDGIDLISECCQLERFRNTGFLLTSGRPADELWNLASDRLGPIACLRILPKPFLARELEETLGVLLRNQERQAA